MYSFETLIHYRYEEDWKTMGKVLFLAQAPSLGTMAKRLRVRQLLTQEELASFADVTSKEVRLFEEGFPVCLEARRRLLKELWRNKADKLVAEKSH